MMSSRLMTRRSFVASASRRKIPGSSSEFLRSLSASVPASFHQTDDEGRKERYLMGIPSLRCAPGGLRGYHVWLQSQSQQFAYLNGRNRLEFQSHAASNTLPPRRLLTACATSSSDYFSAKSMNQLGSYQPQSPVTTIKDLTPQLCYQRFLSRATHRVLADLHNDRPAGRHFSTRTMSRSTSLAYFSTDAKSKEHASTEKVHGASETSNTSAGTSATTNSTLPKKATIAQQVQDTVRHATKAIVNFLVKLPGWTFFYLTHPKELRHALNSMWEAVKHEAHHYWMGTKLLYADVQTAGKLFRRTLQGSALTRRERKQLLRTVQDLFRLVPFSMFVIIPFMEFALPIALRVFPNMLPSTFQDSLKAEENMKRELQSRIAMAQFFQETLQEMAKEQKTNAANRLQNAVGSEKEETVKQEQSAAAMLDFMTKARSGEILPADVIIQFASHFHDDLTLDNMPRMQLINMCRYMNIPPYGGDNFLRFQLRHKIRTLVEDDQRILWEGIGSLTKMELREACQERGMRSTGLSKDAYRRALQQWLDLSVNKHVPISLLIMSRSFFLRDEIISSDDDGSKAVAGLADAISGLDQNIVNEVVLQVATSQEKKSDPEIRKIKLEVLEAQNERILEEQQQREAANKKKEQKEKEKLELEGAIVVNVAQAEATAVPADGIIEESVQKFEETKDDSGDLLSAQEMDAISHLINPDPVTKERKELERIKVAMLGASSEEERQELEKSKASVLDAISQDAPVPVEGEKVYVDQAMPMTATDAATAGADAVPVDDGPLSTSTVTHETVATTSTTVEQEPVFNEIAPPGEAADVGDALLDRTYESLKARVARMVNQIESQLDSVEEKIGDKLHFLDKDGDGILNLEEMADALQRVLKRTLSHEEAMAIAALMDENKDGLFTVDEFKKWIETSKIVQLVKQGQDGDLDRLLIKHTESQKEDPPTTTNS